MAVAIMRHGDALPAVRVGNASSRSFDAYYWQSVFAVGRTLDVKNYIFGLFEDCKTKPPIKTDPGTMQQCWEIVIWPLKACLSGAWPELDWKGMPWPVGSFEDAMKHKPLAGGFMLVLWGLKGDLDYFAKGLFLRHYGKNEFC